MSRGHDVFIASISGILRKDEPIGLVPMETAGVAVIVKDDPAREVLLIRRAERPGDPWSGQVALPGGRVEPLDSSFRETAVRETLEEVGLDLGSARFAGYLGAFQARTRSILVVPSLFLLSASRELRPNAEVSSYRWVPFADLLAEETRTSYRLEWGGRQREFPALDLDDYLVWGLTERILTTLADSLRHHGRARGRQAETS